MEFQYCIVPPLLRISYHHCSKPLRSFLALQQLHEMGGIRAGLANQSTRITAPAL